MEYFSAVKNNDTRKFAGKWMELGKLILGEVTQTEKDKHVMYSLISEYWSQSKGETNILQPTDPENLSIKEGSSKAYMNLTVKGK